MFNSEWDAVERGIGYLERIFDIFIRLIEALFGGSSSTPKADNEPEAV